MAVEAVLPKLIETLKVILGGDPAGDIVIVDGDKVREAVKSLFGISFARRVCLYRKLYAALVAYLFSHGYRLAEVVTECRKSSSPIYMKIVFDKRLERTLCCRDLVICYAAHMCDFLDEKLRNPGPLALNVYYPEAGIKFTVQHFEEYLREKCRQRFRLVSPVVAEIAKIVAPFLNLDVETRVSGGSRANFWIIVRRRREEQRQTC